MPHRRGHRVPALVLALAVAAAGDPGAAPPRQAALLQSEETRAPRALSATEGETTTQKPYQPGEQQSELSLVQATLEELKNSLLKSKLQWFNALVFLMFGLVMVLDGEWAFQALVIGFTFAGAAIIGPAEVSKFWHRDIDGFVMKQIIRFEIGALAAFIAYQGYKGVLVAIASVLGVFAAQHVEGLAESVLGRDAVSEWAPVCIYSLLIVGFLWSVLSESYKKILFVVCPFLGACLVVSSCSFLVVYAVLHLGHRAGSSAEGEKWVEFVLMLWSSSAKDVGLFASDRFHYKVGGKELQLDRMLGYVFWAVVFLLGVWSNRKGLHPWRPAFQRARRAAKEAAAKAEGSLAPGAAAREPPAGDAQVLKMPLLAAEEAAGSA